MKRLYDAICRVEAAIAGTFLVLMVCLILLGGVARSVGHPLNWTIDVSTCLFAWACFLAADIAWRKNSLMAVEVFTDRMPEKVRAALTLFNYALIAAFLIFLIGYGTHLAWVSRTRSFQGIPWISYSWVTMSLPVGAALMLVNTIIKIRDRLAGKEQHTQAVDVV